MERNLLKQVPELFFKPELNGIRSDPLHAMAWKSVTASDTDLQRDLLKNIVLSGSSMMFEDIADRLKAELTGLAPVSGL